MVDILHRVGINASAEKVFAALTTLPGLRAWWIGDADGNPAPDGIIDFRFSRMKVVASVPGKLVQWLCVDGPAEWRGTTLTFRLEYKREQTFVIFTHADWKEPVEFMHHCSTKWASFLLSLRDFVETGEGHPTPRDIKIHVGD